MGKRFSYSCSVDGCERSGYLTKGFCGAHYRRMRRYGDPLGGRAPDGAGKDFILKALNHDSDSCLIWPFGHGQPGYGKTSWNGKNIPAYSLVCELAHGPRPSNAHEAAHCCGVSLCVSPRHIAWKTHAENEADKVAHGTVVRGVKVHTHKLSEAGVLAIRLLPSSVTNVEAARRFSVSPATIFRARNKICWAWLADSTSIGPNSGAGSK